MFFTLRDARIAVIFSVLLEIYLSAMQHSVCGYNLKTYTFTVYSPLTLVGGYASLRKNNFLHSLCLRFVNTVRSYNSVFYLHFRLQYFLLMLR